MGRHHLIQLGEESIAKLEHLEPFLIGNRKVIEGF